MEHELRCNNLSCRALLSSTGHTDSNAIVTTCSHIFCVTCAETIFTDARLCPACESNLPDTDDIVYTSLNPPQTFRTTILAGMNPMIVQDICGRALGFWTYQVTQEIRLQETVLKETKERAAHTEKQVANIVREANSEISCTDLPKSELLSELKVELDQCMRKNRELAETNRESMKQYTKLKNQYEKTMTKSTIANSYVKTGIAANAAAQPGQTLFNVTQKEAPQGVFASGNNSRIGATPSRAFQPAPVQATMRRQHSNHIPAPETLRPVNVVNNSNLQPAYAGHNYGSRSNVSHSSAGSGRNPHIANNNVVQKHGSSYVMEGAAYQPQGNAAVDLISRRPLITTSNNLPPPAGRFKLSTSMSNISVSRMGRSTSAIG